MGDTPPEQLIKEYKRALAHAKGAHYARETEVEYENGWFRVQHVDGTEANYRKRQLRYFTENLHEQELDLAAYEEAISRRKNIEQTADHRKFDAEAFNRGVAERIAESESARLQTQRHITHLSFSRSVLLLLLFATSVGGIIWCYRDSQETKQKQAEEQEAKAKVEHEEWEKGREKRLRELSTAIETTPKWDSDPNYAETLGKNLRPGMKLYSKNTRQFYGYVKDSEWGRVEVVLAETAKISSSRIRGYAVWLQRSYVTDNFVLKRSEL